MSEQFEPYEPKPRFLREGEVLHELMPDLHQGAEVGHVVDYLRANGNTVGDNPGAELAAYLDFLTDRNYGNDGIVTPDFVVGNPDSRQRQVEHAHPMDTSRVPEAYYDVVAEQARKTGHAHHLPFSEERREQLGRSLRASRQIELNEWAGAIAGNGRGPHMGVYAWEAVKKLGETDPKTGEIHERTPGSAEGYPELHQFVLQDAIHEIHDRALSRVKDPSGEVPAAADLDLKTVYAKHLKNLKERGAGRRRSEGHRNIPTVKAEEALTMNMVEAKLAGYPGADLNEQEVKVLYGIDLQGENPRMPHVLPAIRAIRAEMDMPVLRDLARERIHQQVRFAYEAYQEIAGAVAKGKHAGTGEIASFDEVARLVEAKIAEWTESGVLDYAAEKMIDDELPHLLTITPNVPVADSVFPEIEKEFYPHKNWRERMKFKKNRYGFFGKGMYDEQPDGSGLPVRISLVSSKPYFELSHRLSVLGQQKKLAKMQQENPGLNFRVPSILDAIVWARTMRLDPQRDDWYYRGHSPTIRHIDLPQVEQEVMKNVDIMGHAMVAFANALSGKSKRVKPAPIGTEMRNCVPTTSQYSDGISLGRSPVNRKADMHLAIG